MLIAGALSSFDRFVVGPMLVTLAVHFDVPFATAATAATVYYLAYGLTQPIWGSLSDRFGRLGVVRVALAGAIVGNALAAAASSPMLLNSGRLIAGTCFGAVVPSVITYIGDTVSLRNRQRALAGLLAAGAIGSSIATGVAGVMSDHLTWRVPFIISIIGSLITLVGLRGTPESADSQTDGSTRGRIVAVLTSKWAMFVIAVAFVEGVIVLGTLTVLPAVVERTGASASVAGLITALYGLFVLASSRLVRYFSPKPWLSLLVGGTTLVAAQAIGAVARGNPAWIGVAAALGLGWALFHSTIQVWATAVVPSARATSVGLMAGMLFIGSGVGAALAGPFVDEGRVATLFVAGAAITAMLTIVVVVGRRSFVPPPQTV